ncbi:unnamed protein product [Rotaria magnacalcarata]|uniref:ABC transporter domain-containing protein n=2 Tax=Rotaria magnacalcarata TaxID=392030 RepID=A0A819GKF0_9BILA|nr:unnamed protein product [Rotaria magnacalcarata]CAF3885551.1 unnamed protein product [Rotaria magnacalcarata]
MLHPMHAQGHIPEIKFRPVQINTLGDYVRQSNSAWRSRSFSNKQRDLDWYNYLRRQADTPLPHDIPYGKVRKPRIPSAPEDVVISENEDIGLSKINFTSPPVTLTWLDLQAKAPPKDKGLKRTLTKLLCPSKEVSKSKILLKGVSGIVKPGQLVAIMGASGAGKTTLMNVLAHRRPGSLKVSGEVRVNGTKMGRHINRVAGYVQQEELFVPSMTTREHLYFHAMLRLNRDITKEQRVNRVEELLNFLNLKKTENTLIGEPGRIKGLSGGEKRRLLFASEVLSDPPLLFADEPTSGLDGSMAFVICDAMRKLCNQGKTIVCTIHQPSSEIFQLFDTLYLMAEGRVAYFGSRKKAQEFFSMVGFDAPDNYNLADFYIQTLAMLPFDQESSVQRVEHICNEFEKTTLYAQRVAEARQFHAIDDDQTDAVGGLFHRAPKYKASFFTQLRWLMWRSAVDMFKNPFELRLRLVLAIIIGLLFGIIFLQLKYNQQAFQNISAVIFVLIINTSFSSVQHSADSYNRELPLFFKEHDDGIYRTIPYYASRVTLEFPTQAFTMFILVTIVYWMANLYDDVGRYFTLVGILILCAFVASSMGALIGVTMPSPEAAAAIVVPIVIPLMVFAGFFLSAKTVPDWLLWLKYLSWLYYSNEMALINQWEDVTSLDCNQVGNGTCYHTGNDIIDYYGFKKAHYYRNLGLLFALFIGFRLIGIGILLLRAKFQRRSG